MSTTSSSRQRVVRGISYLAVFLGAAIAISVGHDDLSSLTLRPFVISLALSSLHLIFAARQWGSILESSEEQKLNDYGSVYFSQIAKYLPIGGVAQAAIQVTNSANKEEIKKRSALVPISLLLTVLAAIAVGSPLAFAPSSSALVRLFCLISVLSFVSLHSKTFYILNKALQKLPKKISFSIEKPSNRVLTRSFGWSVANLIATSLSFAVVMRSIDPHYDIFTVTTAFSLAWAIGFLVIFVPGGLGVREGALALFLTQIPSSTLLTAALAHRFIVFISEAIMLVAHKIARRVRRTAVV